MAENNKFDVVGTNIAEKATIIWNVADMLRGPFNNNNRENTFLYRKNTQNRRSS